MHICADVHLYVVNCVCVFVVLNMFFNGAYMLLAKEREGIVK